MILFVQMLGKSTSYAVPVFVDLDKTLISATSTHLQIRDYIDSVGILQTLCDLIQLKTLKRSAIKKWLAERDSGIKYEQYFSANVLEVLKRFNSEGRKVILATGALVSTGTIAVERYPVHFDDVLGSTELHRLKGQEKLNAIERYINRTNCQAFVYIGDALIDLKIMRKADESYFTGSRIIYSFAKRFMRITQITRI